MDNSSPKGCLQFLMLIGTIAAWIVSGFVSWGWIEPESFGGAIVFIIVWMTLAKIFDFIFAFLALGIMRMMN